MQTAQLVLVEFGVRLGVVFDVLGKPFGEFVVAVEERGHDEVQERPQLLHVVLDRCAGKE